MKPGKKEEPEGPRFASREEYLQACATCFKAYALENDCLFFVLFWLQPLRKYRMAGLQGDTSGEDTDDLCRRLLPQIFLQGGAGELHIYRHVNGEWQYRQDTITVVLPEEESPAAH